MNRQTSELSTWTWIRLTLMAAVLESRLGLARIPPTGRIILCLITLGSLAGGAWWILEEWRFRSHWRLAQEAVERQDFSEAQAQLDQCLAARPTDGRVHLLAAEIARRTERYDDAEQHLAVAERYQGVTEVSSLEAALLRAQRGDLAPDERFLVTCVQNQHPAANRILEALAIGYLRKARFGLAQHCLDQLLAQEPDNRTALLRRAWLLERMELADDALRDLRRLVELEPANEEYRLLLAALLFDTNQFAEATPLFEGLYAQQPDHRDVILGLARCRRLAGRLDDARRLLERLIQPGAPENRAEDAPLLTEWGRLLIESSQPEAAEPWLRRAVTLAPYEYETQYTLQQCLQQLGKKEEARGREGLLERLSADRKRLNQLTKQIAKTPGDAKLHLETGQILLRSGRPGEAAQSLRLALDLDPNNSTAREALRQATAAAMGNR